MITLKDYMEIIGYKVTEGSEYLWKCYGNKAHQLDSWSGAWTGTTGDGYTIAVVFDTENQTVYEVNAFDYANDRAYRWTHPDFIEARDKEATSRGVDNTEAWDDVDFVELDVASDFVQKAKAIVRGEDYDTRVVIETEFDDETLLSCMKAAHELDITFNEFVERALTEHINGLKEKGEK